MLIAHSRGACMYTSYILCIYMLWWEKAPATGGQCKPSCLRGLLIRVAPFKYQEQPYISVPASRVVDGIALAASLSGHSQRQRAGGQETNI